MYKYNKIIMDKPLVLTIHGLCNIYVEKDDGNIPKFHIKSKDGSLDTIILLSEPKYYKKDFEMLTYTECRELNSYMHSVREGQIIYRAICTAYGMVNDCPYEYEESDKIPNYLYLYDNKFEVDI